MSSQQAKGHDSAVVGVKHQQVEGLRWNVKGRVMKWSKEQIEAVGLDPKTATSKALLGAGLEPEAVDEFEGNLLLNEGINEIWDLVAGNVATAFSNANARIGVGTGTVAAAATQTGLQGTSTSFQGMNTGYPSVTGQTIKFQADFGSGQASFAWEEWSVDNGGGINMNRKVTNLGTKSGGTWTLTVDISLS